VTAVKLMSRAAAIYEVYVFPAQERQPELGGLKKDEGGTLKLVPGETTSSGQGMPNYDHRVALTADFS